MTGRQEPSVQKDRDRKACCTFKSQHASKVAQPHHPRKVTRGRFVQEQGDETLKFWECKIWWSLGGKISDIFPGEVGLKSVTENFTAFFNPTKDMCHLGLTLGASSPKRKGPILRSGL